MADLLGERENTTCLDVGVGANCIYPVLGISEYNWDFIASDINTDSIDSAKEIIKSNPTLKGKVKFRLQKDKNNIFKTVIKPKDKIDVTICNPPFHSSKKEAMRGSMRKVRNLTGKRSKKVKLNFAGMANELICEGGEKQFIQNMISESVNYAENCLWFTTLVSNEKNLNRIYSSLENIEAAEVKTIEYDPNRSAFIARLKTDYGNWAYILAPQDLQIGQRIESGERAPIEVGNALPLRKIPIGSIIHNIKNNYDLDKKKLIIDEVYANEGPKLKRIRPRAQGRAYKILKPTCHITIVVKESS